MPGAVLTFPAIGTLWRIETERELPTGLVTRLHERVKTFDHSYSRFRPDSLVSRLGREPGEVAFPEDARALFALYRRLYDATSGAVTPLVGEALEHLGLDPAYLLRRQPGPAPVVPVWDDVLRVEGTVLTTTRPVVIDVGAAGKGFLVDELAALLVEAGVENFVIDASGDLLHRGSGVERVGLEDPHDPARAIGIVQVSNGALCASSVSRRAWGDGLHHLVDPTTGEPVRGVIASWVTSGSCAVADGLATALFFVGPERLQPHFDLDFDFAYVRLRDDGRAEFSDNLDGEVFG